MKKLHNYLRKHFPNKHICIKHELVSYSNNPIHRNEYTAYIADTPIFDNSVWTNAFNTISELITYCKEKVEEHLKIIE